MSAFKKNELVTYIADWDRKGTVTFRHAVVYSCGKRQMVLTDAETGVEMGRNFAPVVGELTGTFPRMTDEEARSACLVAGAAITEKEAADINLRIERSTSESYSEAMRKGLVELHEPRAMSWVEARESVKAR